MLSINKIQLLLLPLLILFIFSSQIFSQDVDIVPYLKKVESGELQEVKDKLPELKTRYPGSAAVIFLEGVLTEDGQDAVAIYQRIIDKYPNSKYADAAMFRVFSYFYALGLYESAEKMRTRLKDEYPGSPYLKIAKQNQMPQFEKAPEQIEEKKPAVVETYKFAIQAGAFTQLANANNLKNDFERAGYFTEVKEKSVGGTVFQIVYVGKFHNTENAQDFLQLINSRYILNGRIVEITW